jgi:hypothetical protein
MNDTATSEKHGRLRAMRRLERARSIEWLNTAIAERDSISAALSLVRLSIETYHEKLAAVSLPAKGSTTSLVATMRERKRLREQLKRDEARASALSSKLAEKNRLLELAKETAAKAQQALKALDNH